MQCLITGDLWSLQGRHLDELAKYIGVSSNSADRQLESMNEGRAHWLSQFESPEQTI